jgi:hypothetical protein
MNSEVESINELINCIEIFVDCSQYLSVKEKELTLFKYNNKMEKIKDWTSFNLISHLNMNSINLENPEIIILGNSNGDLFYTN